MSLRGDDQMSYGAKYVHESLKKELKNYIIAQYFGKNELLISSVDKKLDEEGILYRAPFIESSLAYKIIEDGISKSDLPEYIKNFMEELSSKNLGVYKDPFKHQIISLEESLRGKDIFVSTGTGSGKTECFMWPMITQLYKEAYNNKDSWGQRGVRAIILYPMNALVSDQLSRLRKLVGDSEESFINTFRKYCGNVRRPQFGMYTGRTPYPGDENTLKRDKELSKTFGKLLNAGENNIYLDILKKEGKIPSKKNMEKFLENLKKGNHITDLEDSELVTRFEMQETCPDILITNYCMLEYMLFRPLEAKIWKETKRWINKDENNKLLIVIDEAHMYKGASGGEVALLIKRLLYKLGIKRDRVQFILTTASMPNENKDDLESVKKFAEDLTSAENFSNFEYLTGEREILDEKNLIDIPDDKFTEFDIDKFENNENKKIEILNNFWKGVGSYKKLDKLSNIYEWMFNNITKYHQFNKMIQYCRGEARPLNDLAKDIFPNLNRDDSDKAISTLLAIAPLAKNEKGTVLFPARMHMLFKGLSGVYACTNPNCKNHHSDGSITLGEIFVNDKYETCPHCGSVVYELYNDRRCGSLFYKGYIIDEHINSLNSREYLWQDNDQVFDSMFSEIHLFIPSKNFSLKDKNNKTKNTIIRVCYLNVKTGYLFFADDTYDGKDGFVKLYYSETIEKGKPPIRTFKKCPNCNHKLDKNPLKSFSVRGNQPFFNLIKRQFSVQPPVYTNRSEASKFPNEGRKVLLFSDSRQRAAKLARDMSDASDLEAMRKLFVRSIYMMENNIKLKDKNKTLQYLYDIFCLIVEEEKINIFYGDDKFKLLKDIEDVVKNRDKGKEYYKPKKMIDGDSPDKFKEYLLRLYCGSFNTFYDTATSWIEPIIEKYDDEFEEFDISPEEFIELFNAFLIRFKDKLPLGNFDTSIRDNVNHYNHDCYGWKEEDGLGKNILEIMGVAKGSEEEECLIELLKNYLQARDNSYFIKLDEVVAKIDTDHTWFRCKVCTEITPYKLRGRCPNCGSEKITELNENDEVALKFWTIPIKDSLDINKKIQTIDTEEHTAQLSHKDQLNSLWSNTEKYEHRFKDIIEGNETPIDILSSTTTMEVGIDIGSLVAVGLRNVPPLRENYQQRAGRAGRRGASLSTIVTYCEDGPHDNLYFSDPKPMFTGNPRRPWIDVNNKKLIERYVGIIVINDFLESQNNSIDRIDTIDFIRDKKNLFIDFLERYLIDERSLHIRVTEEDKKSIKNSIIKKIDKLSDKVDKRSELYTSIGSISNNENKNKKLLDALYEEGIIPTYSFPKDLVNVYINENDNNNVVSRSCDIALNEYAPGRSIVVDKKTYQIGGLYCPSKGQDKSVGRYLADSNYKKKLYVCRECDWFGTEEVTVCPFCGQAEIMESKREILKPWGFAPKNATNIELSKLDEIYTSAIRPKYSTVPEKKDVTTLDKYKNIRFAKRYDQKIIVINKGEELGGFTLCESCGAIVPKTVENTLKNMKKPYIGKGYSRPMTCKHDSCVDVDLGFEFLTDMFVLEFEIDSNVIDFNIIKKTSWIHKASQTLSEAVRMATCKILDIEYSDLVSNYRIRRKSGSFVDIFLYDSLSSGAGYSTSLLESIKEILDETRKILKGCSCDSACHLCLKNYSNQIIHESLNRNYALELLSWGIEGYVVPSLSTDEQYQIFQKIVPILEDDGYEIRKDKNDIVISKCGYTKKIVVYPYMWKELEHSDDIYISEGMINYLRPIAYNKIVEKFEKSN